MNFFWHYSVRFFVACLFAFIPQHPAAAVRAIPDDNLAYPVLIALKNGAQGSGFFFNSSKATFLVTAHHVLFKEESDDLLDSDAKLLSYAKDPKDTGKNEFALDLKALKQHGEIKRHENLGKTAFERQKPAWRNWQTRWTQNPVAARSCGFEPLRRQ